MSKQAFKMTQTRKIAGQPVTQEFLVSVTSCEDRGDHYYVGWHPVHWFTDKRRVPGCDDLGAHGCSKFYKDGRTGFGLSTFTRAPYAVVDAPAFGYGQEALRPL